MQFFKSSKKSPAAETVTEKKADDSAKNSATATAPAAQASSTPAAAAAPKTIKPGLKKKCHVIVTGNEKGGSGKTTTTMHLIVALLRLGFKVGTIDIDSRQRTLSRYIENRKATTRKRSVKLPQPDNMVIQKSPFNLVNEAEEDERQRFVSGMNHLMENNDFVIVDSPGNDTFMSRLAHSYADIVITPINDSFVDLDVLATVDGSTLKIIRPSIYSEMVWEQKLARAKRDGGTIDWIVMRNRLSNIDARNKRFMNKVLGELSRRIGFRVAPGFSERVIYRELFLQGLTVLDVMDVTEGVNVSMSHVAARQEVRDLLKMLKLPKVDDRINELRNKAANQSKAAKKAAGTKADEKAADAATAKADTARADSKTEKSDTKAKETVTAKIAKEAATTAQSKPAQKPTTPGVDAKAIAEKKDTAKAEDAKEATEKKETPKTVATKNKPATSDVGKTTTQTKETATSSAEKPAIATKEAPTTATAKAATPATADDKAKSMEAAG